MTEIKEEKSLRDQAVEYASAALERGEVRRLARAIGVGYEWFYALARGQIPNPGVNGVERVLRYRDRHGPPSATAAKPRRPRKTRPKQEQ